MRGLRTIFLKEVTWATALYPTDCIIPGDRPGVKKVETRQAGLVP